jgi:hypothetical protein
MSLKFNCSHCSSEIITFFVKVGEEAKCLKCKKKTVVPDNAKTTDESSSLKISLKNQPTQEIIEEEVKNKKVDEKIIDSTEKNKNTGLHVDIEAMFGDPLLKVDGGVTEILYLYSKKLIIAPRKTLLGKLEGGGHEIIYLKHIKDIEFKYGGTLATGYIQFRTSSSGNNKKSGILPVFETANDPNTVHFQKKMNDKMFKILKLVDKCIEN